MWEFSHSVLRIYRPDADTPTAEVRKINVPVMLDFIGEVRTGVDMPEAACEQQKQERTNHFN